MNNDDDKFGAAQPGDRIPTGVRQNLEQLKQIAMSHGPEPVDLDQLKRDIASGDYRPDLKTLADRILSDPDMVEQLLTG